MTLQYFVDNNMEQKVLPPQISMKDFEKGLSRAKPTVGIKDLGVFEDFTREFGEEG